MTENEKQEKQEYVRLQSGDKQKIVSVAWTPDPSLSEEQRKQEREWTEQRLWLLRTRT